MTLILEFERKLIFFRPGILRYAMRLARMYLTPTHSPAERRNCLSRSLKRGWIEAKAERAALERPRILAPQVVGKRPDTPLSEAPQIVLGCARGDGWMHKRMGIPGNEPSDAEPTVLPHNSLH